MEIRIRETGAVVAERDFRAIYRQTSFPRVLSESVLSDFGCDVVLEGPQASCEWWQHSQRSGVEQINGKWYSKYVAGPIFDTVSERDAYISQKFADRKAALRAGLTERRQQKMRLPITVGQLTIDPDDKDMLEAHIAKGNPLAQRKRRLKSGQRVLMTPAIIDAILLAYDAHVQACWDRDYDLCGLIDAATTIAELDAIDIIAGWPA